jgi:hypothetical protein
MNKARFVIPMCVLLLVCAGVRLTASPLAPAQSIPFMICLQDDTNARLIRISTFDSTFRYENCAAGSVIMGKGTIVVVNQTLVLTSQGVSATVDLGSNSGSASVQEFNGSPSLISDSNTVDSACFCPAT